MREQLHQREGQVQEAAGVRVLRVLARVPGLIVALGIGLAWWVTAAQQSTQAAPNSSSAYTVRCDPPRDHDEADLCEQRRMAAAAETSVSWLNPQTLIGIAQAIGLVLTIILTVVATKAASRAAQAAEATIRHEEEREAPFVYPAVISNGVPDALEKLGIYDHPKSKIAPASPTVSCAIANHGRSPALMQYITVDLVHLTMMPEQMPISGERDFSVAPIIAAGVQSNRLHPTRIAIPIDREAAESIKERKSWLYLFGEIHFGSVNGTAYRQSFCMAYDHRSRSFTPWYPKLNQRYRLS